MTTLTMQDVADGAAVVLLQGHCRGCAEPTFMFDPNIQYTPDKLYCDRCYGIPNRFAYGGDPDPNVPTHVNTGPTDPAIGEYDWQRICRAKGVDPYRCLPNIANHRPTTALPIDLDEDGEARREVPTCQCGGTRFQYVEFTTAVRYYVAIDTTDEFYQVIEDDEVDPDYIVNVGDGGTDWVDDDGDVQDARLECTGCGRHWQGMYDY